MNMVIYVRYRQGFVEKGLLSEWMNDSNYQSIILDQCPVPVYQAYSWSGRYVSRKAMRSG